VVLNKNIFMQLTEQNFIEIAQIHKDRLKDFIADCSVEFISLFYKTIIKLPSVKLITEKDKENDKVIGLYLLTTNKKEYLKYFFKKNIINIILSPSSYIPIIKAILSKLRHKSVSPVDNKHEGVYICVARGYENGTGLILIEKAENEIKSLGYNDLYAMVFEENKLAIKFFKAVGYKIIGEQNTLKGKKFIIKKILI
jgi:hypothetical protein